jgi:putative Mn2+ efflux pump MntP
MSIWVKLVALGSMAVSLLYVGLVVGPPWYAFAPMVAIVAAGAIFIVRLPSRAR